jgi:hypothetical protein
MSRREGIEGYKGVIKRMLNSGMVASIVAEAVHVNDSFDWRPGLMRVPLHEPDWFADRGECPASESKSRQRKASSSLLRASVKASTLHATVSIHPWPAA